MKCAQYYGAMLAVVVSLSIGSRSFAVIIDNGDAGYSETGSWVTSDPGGHPRVVDDTYRASNTGGSTATFNPGLNGNYFIQVHWGLHPAHSDAALFTVNDVSGAHAYAANMQQSAAQGAGGAFDSGSSLPVEGSGWYSLGGNGTQFTLNGASNIVLTRTSGTSFIIADGVRISTNFVADERAAAISGTWSSIATASLSGGLESTQYLSSTDAGATATYQPGVSGYFELAASWGVGGSNTTSAEYLVDLDGNLGTIEDQTSFLINQRLLNDQATMGAETDWSGYRTLFSTHLAVNSIIVLSNDLGSGNLSADGLLLTPAIAPVPEPSTFMCLGLGLVVMRRKSHAGGK